MCAPVSLLSTGTTGKINPYGNFSDSSSLNFRDLYPRRTRCWRFARTRFLAYCHYWRQKLSQLLTLFSTKGFWPFWADHCTPALSFNRCAAPAKLPTWTFPLSIMSSPRRLNAKIVPIRHSLFNRVSSTPVRNSGITLAMKHLPPILYFLRSWTRSDWSQTQSFFLFPNSSILLIDWETQVYWNTLDRITSKTDYHLSALSTSPSQWERGDTTERVPTVV